MLWFWCYLLLQEFSLGSVRSLGHSAVNAGPSTHLFIILMVWLIKECIFCFSCTFLRNNANSKEIWMFQRYGLILQYEMRPILPPPFIIITHIYLALKYIKRRCKGKRDFYDNGLSKLCLA